ncbi:glycosyltransferase [Lentzea sp. NPDC059081]|uniref:glycosyltransferase n=1 Tax=Lentzea sp. NPDC059081 TaxID=3346719 RepID=UPI003677906F
MTPVHPPHMRFLPEAYESLRAQELPRGWSWEWLIQHDGEAESELFSDDSRVAFSSSSPSGPAGARNMALARSSGRLVRNLDADDLFLEGALTRDVEVLERHGDIGWVTSSARDLLSNGDVISWEFDDPAEGVLEPGRLLDAFISDEWRLPVVPGSLCVRRDLLLALGGWMALPSSEDTGLLMALQTVSRGYFIAAPSMLYRKHGVQQTAREVHNDPVDKKLRYGMIVDRAQALRNLLAQPTTPR